MKDPRDFILNNTQLTSAAAVPELKLHLATEVTPLWQATEAWLDEKNCPPPYWAFPWAGGQALARYILDHAAEFSGKHVIDFATGCGIAALAAAKAGASVTGTEIDDLAIAAAQLNAEANQMAIDVRKIDRSDPAFANADIITAADICYEPAMTADLIDWLRVLAGQGKTVLLADPGRAYLPKTGLQELTSYVIPTSFDLENVTERRTTIYRLQG